MSDRESQRRLDRLAMRYLTAVEAGDFDTVGDLWVQGQTDLELGDMLHELNAELVAQRDAEAAAAAKGALESAIEKHLPSAEVIRPVAGPLTVAEVAEHLRRNPPGGMTTDDLKANDLLRASAETLPAELGLMAVVSWGRKFGAVPEGYWKAFREAALLLRMRRESAANYQMAARPTKPPPKAGGGKA
jgi:hypothetical protein